MTLEHLTFAERRARIDMEFDTVYRSDGNGVLERVDPQPFTHPGVDSVYQDVDSDGQCIDNVVHGVTAGWSLLDGYSGQQSYSGPVMHSSEYIGGRMAEYIRETPGMYVAVIVDASSIDDDGDSVIGWAIAHTDENTE